MRGRGRGVLVGAIALAVLPLAVAPAASGRAAGDVCARFGPVQRAGTVADASLVEISGLAGSRAHPGVMWAHNDSGGLPQVVALGEDGRALGAYTVAGATATDWEDVATGPGPVAGRSYLYVGDIGDNNAQRASVTVYRVPEPSAAPSGGGGTLTGTEVITLKYPGGPSDAEALLVDPVTRDLLIVTKSYAGASRVLRAAASSLAGGATVTMRDEGALQVSPPAGSPGGLPGTAVTGGDVSPDGSIVLLRTYRSVLAFARGSGETVGHALVTGQRCFAPQAEEPQGEAVAFTGGGGAYLTASEGSAVPVNRVAVGAPRPATTTTTAAPATTTTRPTSTTTEGGGSGPALGWPVAGAAAVLVGAAGIVLWRRR